MSKVNILTLQKHKKNLVNKLHESGIMQIEETSDQIQNFSDYLKEGQPLEEDTNYRKYHNKAREIIEVLEEGKKNEEKSFTENLKEKLTKSKIAESKEELVKKDIEFIEDLHKKTKSNRKKLEEINTNLSRLNDFKEDLKPYRSLELPLKYIKKGEYVTIILGNSSLEDVKDIKTRIEEKEINSWIEIIEKDEEKSIFVIAYLNKEKDEVQKILRKSRAELFTNDQEFTKTPKKEIDKLNSKINSFKEKKSKVKSSIGELREQYFEEIVGIKKTLENEIERMEINNKFAESKTITLLEGWVPTKKEEKLKSIANQATNNISALETREAKKEENPPVDLDNPSFLKGFESLVRTFGLPRYNEIDPTPILALFLPLFFGIMFGDLGHGLIVLLVGISLYKVSEGTVNDFSKIIIPCGIFSMIFGFLYGEFMGRHIAILGAPFLHVNPIEEIFHPKVFLLIALGFGVIHLLIGMALDLVNKIKNQEYKSVVEPVSKIWIFLGALSMVILYRTQSSLPNMPLLAAVVLLPILLLILSPVIEEWGELEGLKPILPQMGDGFFESFHTILSFIANTISYSRLFALALVHMGLFIALARVSSIFAKMLGFPAFEPVLWFLIYSVGTIIILALDGLIVFLHSLRLHYYEMFDKFFGTTGSRPFNPFKSK